MLQNALLLIVATGLISLSLGQFFIAGWTSRRASIRHRAIRRSKLDQLRSATKFARLNSQLTTAAQNSGQWRIMEVVKVMDESADARSFYLADPNKQELPAFHPGQHLMVRPAMAGKYQATRCYSLSVAPNSKLWRITVKRQSTEQHLRKDRKSGGLSLWLHENIREGDCLLIGGPNGHFFLPPENRSPLVLLAAGVGVTPMASMLQYSAHFTPKRQVSLYYQVKDAAHWPLGSEVHAYSQGSETCRVHSYFSRANDQVLQQLADQHSGSFRSGKFVGCEIVQEVGVPQAHYYMCGPEPWMQSLRDELTGIGVPENQIHWESFGGASVSTNKTQSDQAHAVEFVRSGIKTCIDGSEQSLWELAQANDVVIPSSCLSGVCGSCRVRLLSGSVQYDRQVSVSLGSNECLSCVARPTSDVKVDV